MMTQISVGNNTFDTPKDFLAFVARGDAALAGFSKAEIDAQDFGTLLIAMAERTREAEFERLVLQANGRENIIINTDSYKMSHYVQYPKGTKYVYSYIESRGGAYDYTLFYGLQSIIKEFLLVRVTRQMIDAAERIAKGQLIPFNRKGWEYIVDKLGGKLPLRIKAVPEGTVVPGNNVLATVVNTDPNCFWLTSYVESLLLRVWYPITVATRSHAAKRVIRQWLELTSDNVEAVLPTRLHDFGARGVSSYESAEIGGSAHLVNFVGTDTVPAIPFVERMYGTAATIGISVPAAEHSTVTSWGRENEVEPYRNMLRQFARPGSYVAVVSDSYDLWNAVDNIWGTELRQHVIDSGATLIVRPDSGDVRTVPVECVVRLGERFGYTVNSKGFRVLKHVAVIQGDGIDDEHVIDDILRGLSEAGYSAENIAFGMGGGLLQKLNRDTLKFAMKCSAIAIVEDEDGDEPEELIWRDVFKDPVTDHGKRSKKGRLALIRDGEEWKTTALDRNKWQDELKDVFLNGELLIDYTFDEVRERSNRLH